SFRSPWEKRSIGALSILTRNNQSPAESRPRMSCSQGLQQCVCGKTKSGLLLHRRPRKSRNAVPAQSRIDKRRRFPLLPANSDFTELGIRFLVAEHRNPPTFPASAQCQFSNRLLAALEQQFLRTACFEHEALHVAKAVKNHFADFTPVFFRALQPALYPARY